MIENKFETYLSNFYEAEGAKKMVLEANSFYEIAKILLKNSDSLITANDYGTYNLVIRAIEEVTSEDFFDDFRTRILEKIDEHIDTRRVLLSNELVRIQEDDNGKEKSRSTFKPRYRR